VASVEDYILRYARLMAKCEAVRILGKMRYDPVYVFATSRINPLPYQLEDFLTLLDMLDVGDVRVLLAYETGLGKTIVSGLFIREVLLKQPEARVLIVAPPAATNQWKSEMKNKFGLYFSDYMGVEDLSKQLLIASVDTFKRRIRELEERGTKWDVVVADELHRATPGNLRYALLELLSKRTQHLLALTATPHDGKEENFIGRLQLILPSVDEENYRRFLEERSFRRKKSEVTDLEGNRLFPYPVSVKTVKLGVSPEEEEFYSAVEEYVRTVYRRVEGRNSPLGLWQPCSEGWLQAP
jgi:DNA or RNA helicases of superfamily II